MGVGGLLHSAVGEVGDLARGVCGLMGSKILPISSNNSLISSF